LDDRFPATSRGALFGCVKVVPSVIICASFLTSTEWPEAGVQSFLKKPMKAREPETGIFQTSLRAIAAPERDDQKQVHY
jgi:hypothetical protein